MLSWLSSYDLKLFLNLLENSAKKDKKQDMQRMFPPRKAFMEGLLKQNLVKESRLILTSSAEQHLESILDKKEIIEFSRTTGPLSLIYLRLSGDIHMIEGSHSFALKIMNKLPKSCKILDYKIKKFSIDDFRGRIRMQYEREYNDSSGIIEIKHNSNLMWQHHAIEFLQQNGIAVKASEVIPANQYRSYKLRFGA